MCAEGDNDMYDYDVLCIGSGPGGSAAAMRCADRGKRVAVAEARPRSGSGGTCVNRGCIPTKTLLASANLYAAMREAESLGIGVDMSQVTVDLAAINRRRSAVSNGLSFGLETFLWKKSRGIEVIKGRARLIDAHTAEIETARGTRRVSAEYIVLAPGSEPAAPESFHVDRLNILTSDEVMDFSGPLPASIIIAGSGAVGLEYAHILNCFGTAVTVVEQEPEILPSLRDGEACGALREAMEKRGVSFRLGCGVSAMEALPEGVACRLESGEELFADKALAAVGRRPNTQGLGLEDAGVELDESGLIRTDEKLRTSVPNIFAAGDATAGPQLSDKAQRQGLVIAETIAGNDFGINYDAIPATVFTEPQLAAVGLTEADAAERGIAAITGRLPYSSNEKAMTMGRTEGFIKVVAAAGSHAVLGAQIVGAGACDLIAELTLAVENGLTLEQVYGAVHPHPTLSELVMEACKRAVGLAFDRQS